MKALLWSVLFYIGIGGTTMSILLLLFDKKLTTLGWIWGAICAVVLILGICMKGYKQHCG